MKSPLVFEDRRDGRIDAMLGAVAIGSIVPIDHPTNRAAYTFALPPGRGFRFVRDSDKAKHSLLVLTREWLKSAGVAPT
jgi:hypothetical protein